MTMAYKEYVEGPIFECLEEKINKQKVGKDERGVYAWVKTIKLHGKAADSQATLLDNMFYYSDGRHGPATDLCYENFAYSLDSPPVAVYFRIYPDSTRYWVIGRDEDIAAFERLLQEEAFPHEAKGINANTASGKTD